MAKNDMDNDADAVLLPLTQIHKDIQDMREEASSRKFRGFRGASNQDATTRRTVGSDRNTPEFSRTIMAGNW